jgi:hypothetical protein
VIASWLPEMPSPTSVVTTVPPGAPVSVSWPLRVPVVVGVNVMVTVHVVPPASSVPLHVPPVAAKSPVTVWTSAPDGTSPRFATVTVSAALVCPTTTEPSPIWSGTTRRLAAARPVPVTAPLTLPPGVPETWNSADFAPAESGARRTWNVHVAAGASVMPAHRSALFAKSLGSLPAGTTLSAPVEPVPVLVTVNVATVVPV